MSNLILHHYPNSPFAEKIRTILGFKALAWTSVIIPVIMPKPDVVALTGGYRKTPVLQIGADIYCDTALIARVLERIQPAPTLFPASAAGIAALIAQWADSTLFWTAIPFALQPAGAASVLAGLSAEQMEAFRVDRTAFRAQLPRMRSSEATAGLTTYLGALEAMLADQRAWLCGAEPSIADFSVYHCLWFVQRAGSLAKIFDSVPGVSRWYAKMRAIGHGTSEKLDSGEAIALAASSTPIAVAHDTLVDVGDLVHGDRVTMAATDTGCDPVAGELVAASAESATLRRVDERAGEVFVHFPRIGFELRRAA
jgi:glutathione S-transferase